MRNALKNEPEKYPHGVKPTTFKHCIGGTHEEFSSGRQQDALEFFSYFVDLLDTNVFRNLSTLASQERKPLQPRPVNISQLVASQKLRSPPNTPASAKSPASLLSNAISRSRPKSHDGSLRSVAQVIGSDYH